MKVNPGHILISAFPSCCAALVLSFLKLSTLSRGTNWVTKGCHHKWYYPWRIPDVKQRDMIAAHMFDKITITFGRSYQGFRVKTVSPLSDREGQTRSSSDDGSSLSDDDKVIRIMRELRIARDKEVRERGGPKR